MIPVYSSFHAEIKNLKYITEEGQRLPKTAILTFQVPQYDHPVIEILGYIEPEEIYRMIDTGKSVNLDFCYIDKFSLTDYRNLRNLDSKKYVEIKGFSARQTFIDTHTRIDFSFAEIYGGFSLESAHIARGQMNFSNAVFHDGDVNLSNVNFRDGNFNFSNVRIGKGEVNFKNTVFGSGKKDFQYTNFGNGEKNFTNTEFNDGEVSFINTHFNNGDFSLKVARFGSGPVSFHFAKFGTGDKSFERTEFGSGMVDFRTVEFGRGRVNFNRAVFDQGDISFDGSELEDGRFSLRKAHLGKGRLSFDLSDFSDADIDFERTDFGEGTLSFYNAKFKTLSLRSCHLDNYTDLRVSKCGYIDLSDSVVRDIIDIKPYEFSEDIDIINFTGMRLIGRIYIGWKENKVKQLIYNQKDTNNRQKSEQFRTLKQNFNVTGQYNDEDKSYVEFKRLEAKADLEDSLSRKPVSVLWMYPVYWFKLLLFDKAGLYATNPARVMISMLFIYVFFSLLYVFLMVFTTGNILSSVTNPDKLSKAGTAFYHSAITFFTIGYGDHYPVGIVRVFSGIEGFVGVFLMAYFTVAFVRKILR